MLPVPYVEQLADRYFPASLSGKDCPKLLQEGAAVDTLSAGTVLGAYNWPANSLPAHRSSSGRCRCPIFGCDTCKSRHRSRSSRGRARRRPSEPGRSRPFPTARPASRCRRASRSAVRRTGACLLPAPRESVALSSHSPSTPSCPLTLSACACAFAASAVARPNDRTARTRTSPHDRAIPRGRLDIAERPFDGKIRFGISGWKPMGSAALARVPESRCPRAGGG